MSGTGWFEEAELNYAEHVFRNAARTEEPAVLHQSEIRPLSEGMVLAPVGLGTMLAPLNLTMIAVAIPSITLKLGR